MQHVIVQHTPRQRMTDPEISRLSRHLVAPEERVTKLESEVAMLRVIVYTLVVGLLVLGLARALWAHRHPKEGSTVDAFMAQRLL